MHSHLNPLALVHEISYTLNDNSMVPKFIFWTQQREAFRLKRKGEQYTSWRDLPGANEWLQRSRVRKVRLAVQSKPHYFWS
jgi:hypothetical protein